MRRARSLVEFISVRVERRDPGHATVLDDGRFGFSSLLFFLALTELEEDPDEADLCHEVGVADYDPGNKQGSGKLGNLFLGGRLLAFEVEKIAAVEENDRQVVEQKAAGVNRHLGEVDLSCHTFLNDETSYHHDCIEQQDA